MTTTSPGPRRILSGVQPSGKLHLGNYFGAVKQHIALQDEGLCFYFIADYHALTTIQDPSTLRDNTSDVALDYLALGLDPDRAVFFRQSDVPEVTELAWVLSTVTNMGLLERAVSYKEKVEKGIEASVGLFTYPVLMAADILIYRSHVVPVGRDQVQHIEMTQDMAGKFNRAYGNVFPIPDYRLDKESKVPGIDGQKMSKSYGNTIDIFAEGKPLKKTVMSIVTDSSTVADAKDPERCNVFALYSLFATPEEKAALAARYRAGGMGYGEAKQALLAKIEAYFAPARERRKQLAKDAATVDDVLRRGALRARAEAQQTMAVVRESVGMGSRPVA
ncbi:MAG TPA: tryptophan--tRNA ligase [Gemmataceae bacterium]|jgi:tryptophanyl-tRNA synthetase|nr:tryptophan--tRNA ligase [Gemmataceae bacterium]